MVMTRKVRLKCFCFGAHDRAVEGCQPPHSTWSLWFCLTGYTSKAAEIPAAQEAPESGQEGHRQAGRRLTICQGWQHGAMEGSSTGNSVKPDLASTGNCGCCWTPPQLRRLLDSLWGMVTLKFVVACGGGHLLGCGI